MKLSLLDILISIGAVVGYFAVTLNLESWAPRLPGLRHCIEQSRAVWTWWM